MAAAFVALGASVLATAIGSSYGAPANRSPRAARVLLGISGVAGAAVAAFPTLAETPQTATDYAEVLASLVFFVGFGVASAVISLSAWSGRRRTVAAVLSGAFGLCFIFMLVAPDGIHGLLMRVAALCLVAWVIVNASWLAHHRE